MELAGHREQAGIGRETYTCIWLGWEVIPGPSGSDSNVTRVTESRFELLVPRLGPRPQT